MTFPYWVIAQGIQFEKDNWKTVKNKANKENKLIYLDVYTTWCAPCKYMALNYFPTREAGDFYNKNFVNYKVDAETEEGIDIAKEFKVDGFPTNLFIEAQTGKIVYRTSGMPSTLEGFIKNGSTALEEQKSPMTMEAYKEKFRQGNYDEIFLKEYLEKKQRLEENNDSVIDAYLNLCCKDQVTDSALSIILKYQTGIENDGYQILLKHSEDVDRLKQQTGYLNKYKKYWYYHSLGRAADAGDEKKVEELLEKVNDFNLDDPTHNTFYYREKVLTVNDDTAKLWKVRKRFAEATMNMTDKDYTALFEKTKYSMIEQIKWQAKQQGAKEEDMEKIIKMNLERPVVKYMNERNYANTLNEIAWDVYEKNKNKFINKERIRLAIIWVKKAMDLTKELPESWIANADTYSHLLYLSGSKAEAMALEKEVILKAKEIKDKGLDDYEAFLNEMNKN